jgi:anti-sigma B factor antagonist
MDISHRRLPRVDILAISGRMSAPEAQELQAKIDQLLAEGRVCLVLDVAGLEFMSSPGLRVMIEARRKAQGARAEGGGHGDLRLAGANPYIKEILARTGFTSFFPVYEEVVEAVASY